MDAPLKEAESFNDLSSAAEPASLGAPFERGIDPPALSRLFADPPALSRLFGSPFEAPPTFRSVPFSLPSLTLPSFALP